MAYTTINKSTDYFDNKLWTGNETDNRDITGFNFQPDFAWIKARNNSYGHALFDAVRGVNKYLCTNSTTAEVDQPSSGYISQFNSDGYRLKHGSSTFRNVNDADASTTYVSWNWKANGAGSANSNGTISSTVSANTTAGFSIVSYTGTGSNATVGHGLGAVPKMIIVKDRTSGTNNNWYVYHIDTGNDKRLRLDLTSGAGSDATAWNNTSPTSSVFTVGTNGNVNASGNTYIAYCFAEKTGYSKISSYIGNSSNNADAPFVYTGFKTSFVLIKNIEQASAWEMYDKSRDGYNPKVHGLRANASDTEDNSDDLLDLLSNGFKLRHQGSGINENNDRFIYLAFGQSLVGSNNVPATAR
jgi:hypothetical protein